MTDKCLRMTVLEGNYTLWHWLAEEGFSFELLSAGTEQHKQEMSREETRGMNLNKNGKSLHVTYSQYMYSWANSD